MEKYVRLLTYKNATKVVDYVRECVSCADANIVVGGLCIRGDEDGLSEITNYIESLNVRFEVSSENPIITNRKLAEKYKKKAKL